jgi:hypothetical protein
MFAITPPSAVPFLTSAFAADLAAALLVGVPALVLLAAVLRSLARALWRGRARRSRQAPLALARTSVPARRAGAGAAQGAKNHGYAFSPLLG